MGRQVRKGEKALWILAPITARGPRPDADGAVDADDLGGPDTTSTGPAPRTATGPRRAGVCSGSKGSPVFDIARPMVTRSRPHRARSCWKVRPRPGCGMRSPRRSPTAGSPSPDARLRRSIGGANGVTDYTTRTVTVRADVDDAMAVQDAGP